VSVFAPLQGKLKGVRLARQLEIEDFAGGREEGEALSASRITKKQLKEDKFASAVFTYGELARKHQRSIVGLMALLLIVIFGSIWGVRYMRSSELEANQAFSTALQNLQAAIAVSEEAAFISALDEFTAIRNNHGGRDVGKWAIYFEGYCYELNQQYKRAEQLYTEYLDADGGGEYEIPARLGIAASLGSMGHMKRQADALIEVAGLEGITQRQAHSWIMMAGQIYMDAGYFENARSAFEELLPIVDASMKNAVENQLKALRALRS